MATGMAMGMAMASQRSVRCTVLGIGLGCLAAQVIAGEWTISPTIAVTETATDNVGQASKNKSSDLVSNIAPGISIAGTGDRVKLRFDYQMNNLIYVNDSSRNNVQHALNTQGTLEALENWFYIDANASISQQNLSAFGGSTNSSVDTNNSSNTAETTTYRVSPYFKGTLGMVADYQLRYNVARTSSDSGNSNNTETKGFSGRLAGISRGSIFGWAVDGNTQENRFDRGRDTESDLVRGTLTYQYDPQFRVSLIGGRESNNYSSTGKESHTIKGAGFDWAPTDRTLLSVSREDRFFGNSDSISFDHRTAGTAWKYRQTKDAYTSTDQWSGSAGTYFDLFNSIYASVIPNAALRAAFVNALLAASGISPSAQLQGGFLTNGVTLQQRRQLSFALIGVRNTVTFAATTSETENFSGGVGSGWFTGSDFSTLNNIKQKGLSVNWSHKLTGLSSLVGSVSRLTSKGTGTTSVQTDENLYSINFVTQLGPKTTAGLGARRVEVDGSSNYTENAITGTFSHRF